MPTIPLFYTTNFTIVNNRLTMVATPTEGDLHVFHYSYIPSGASSHAHAKEEKSAWAGGSVWDLGNTPDLLDMRMYRNTAIGIPYAAARHATVAASSMYASYDSAGWIEKDAGDDPPASSDLLQNLGGILFHLVDYDGMPATSVLRRSNDSGETWTTLTRPLATLEYRDLVRDSSGRLLLLIEDNSIADPGQYHIYSSLDNGDTWTLYSTRPMSGASGGIALSLAPHPTNSRRLAVMMTNKTGGIGRLDYTTNDGAAWTLKSTGLGALQGTQLIQLANNRLIFRTGIAATRIQTSDDDGDTWVERYTLTAGAPVDSQRFIKISESIIILVLTGATERAVRSIDGGTTWANLGAWPAAFSSAAGYAYHNDVLYALDTLNGNLYSLNQVTTRAWDAVGAGNWTTLTALGFNLATSSHHVLTVI